LVRQEEEEEEEEGRRGSKTFGEIRGRERWDVLRLIRLHASHNLFIPHIAQCALNHKHNPVPQETHPRVAQTSRLLIKRLFRRAGITAV
jgi:hypothetical protein